MRNRTHKNREAKSFVLSREGALLIFSLFWLAIILRSVIKEWWAVWVRFSSILFHIFILFFITLLSWAVGRKISQALKLEYSHVVEEFPFATALGLSCLSYLTFLLGAVGLLYRRAVYLVTGLVVILVLKEIRNIFWALKDAWDENKNFKPTSVEVLLFSLLGLTLLISLIGTFTPPLSYDALAYHLGVPKIYMKNQRIIALPFHVYSNFPFNVEMLYTYSILLTGGETVAKMIHFLFAVLTSFTLYAMGRRYFNWRLGLLSAAIFINIPLVGQLSTLCYNDLGLALFVSLAIFSFMNWYSLQDIPRKQYGLSWLITSGVFTGLAIGTKYTGITLLFLFLVLAVTIYSVTNTKRRRLGTTAKNVALFITVVIAVFSPWLIKNFLLTGNPFFPFLYPLLGGGNWTDELYQRFMNVHMPATYSVQDFFSSLWRLLTGHSLGFIFIIILPAILFLRGVEKYIKVLLLYATYFYIMWYFFTHHVDRFAIPLFSLLSLVCAWIIHKIPKKGRILLGSLTGIFMSVNLFILLLLATNYGYFDVFTGMKTKDEYLSEKLYYYPAIKYINEELPPSSNILFIGDNQTYYCQRPLLSNSPLDKNIIVEEVRKSKDAEEVARRLKNMGVTYIYLNATEVKRTQKTYSSFYWNEEEYNRFNEFIEKYTKKLFEKNGCFIWELR